MTPHFITSNNNYIYCVRMPPHTHTIIQLLFLNSDKLIDVADLVT